MGLDMGAHAIHWFRGLPLRAACNAHLRWKDAVLRGTRTRSQVTCSACKKAMVKRPKGPESEKTSKKGNENDIR